LERNGRARSKPIERVNTKTLKVRCQPIRDRCGNRSGPKGRREKKSAKEGNLKGQPEQE